VPPGRRIAKFDCVAVAPTIRQGLASAKLAH
jgi:hypothetical protein